MGEKKKDLFIYLFILKLYCGAYPCLVEMWFAGAVEAVKTLVSDNYGLKKKKNCLHTS